MTRFYGRVGFGGTTNVDQEPGVYVDGIYERSYYGDVIRNSKQDREGESLHPDISVQNSISIVADTFVEDHFMTIRYVEWAGVLWSVSSVEVQHPRLILRLGEVYNGPTQVPVTPTP